MKEFPPAAPLETLIGAPVGEYVIGVNFEERLASLGYSRVAGIDEAGRGPLAGPVVAAVVILEPDNIPEGLNDSKKLGAAKREQLYDRILNNCHVSIASINSATIDRINIRRATLLCMENAASALAIDASWHLVDGRDVPKGLRDRSSAIIKGDGRSVTVAAASIIAKVTRDRMMVKAGNRWPQYGFENHKGYGTRAHIEAIHKYGPCPLHRFSFAPVKGLLL